jgi:hypothetical protein
MTKPKVELTPADIANGWTAETLAEHVAQTEAAEYKNLMNRLFPAKPAIRIENCASFRAHEWSGSYDPHNW